MVVTYETALKLARTCWDEVDYVTEHSDAYVFSKKDDLSFGGNGPVVVLKSSGRCINMTDYLDNPSSAVDCLCEGYISER